MWPSAGAGSDATLLGSVQELIHGLPAGARVLDLGCGAGSFDAGAAFAVRLDLETRASRPSGEFVIGDAAQLPLAEGAFDAVICNHTLEHMDRLERVLAEIARVLRRDGWLYVSVPDAGTLTDRLYQWIYHGGGHVNAFRSAEELARRITASTGLPHRATRTLYSSFVFLERYQFKPRPPRRLWLVGGGHPLVIAWMSYAFRLWDRVFGTRASVYGWALYFGQVPESVETAEWRNVCVHCGEGNSEAWLRESRSVGRKILFLESYCCRKCGAWNLLTAD